MSDFYDRFGAELHRAARRRDRRRFPLPSMRIVAPAFAVAAAVFALALVVVSRDSASPPAPAPLSATERLAGTYLEGGPAASRADLTLTLTAAGEYRLVPIVGLGRAVTTGTFTAHPGEIRFSGDARCPQDDGVYRWARQGVQLTFTTVRDPCESRRAVLPGQVWLRE